MTARPTVLIAVASTALFCATPAQAAPGEPTPPPPPPLPATEFVPQQAGIGNVLGQSGSQPAGLFGLPDLSGYGSNLLLGQTPGPVIPGAPATAVVPNLNAFNPEYLLGQNATPAAPGDGAPAPGLGPDSDSPDTGRIAFLRRLYEMYQAGALKGSMLGQQSPEEFADQAVTAPPPTG